jgi:hypothetical protein
MSKKVYEAIAAILLDCSKPPKATHKQIAILIANYFASESKKFNREKFLQACNVKENAK